MTTQLLHPKVDPTIQALNTLTEWYYKKYPSDDFFVPHLEHWLAVLDGHFHGNTHFKGYVYVSVIAKGEEENRHIKFNQRTALLTELRDSGLLEEKKEHQDWCKLAGELEYSSCGCWKDHNTLAKAIKAHINNLINPTIV